MTQNEWAEYVKFGSRYEPKQPTPNAHYFDVNVFKNNLSQKTKTSIMKLVKKLLGIAIVIGMLSSCSSYRNVGGGGCGVWMPKKYNGAAPKMRTGAHMVTF
jgi:hypothetical protein